MEKDKSRGIKHIKDKRKYKGNSKKNPKHVPPKGKPTLESNWDRYEGAGDDHEYKLSSSTDYAILSNAPISTGSHFQFKSDKLDEEHVTRENDLFFLNLDLLHNSIITIPFYERLGIPKKYFNAAEITQMEENAAKNLVLYEQSFKNTPIENVNADTKIIEDSLKDTDDSVDEDDILESTESEDEDHKDLHIPADTEHKEDLEQWLDDILED